MAALDGLPRFQLRFAKFGFLRRMPSDGGGIKENDCAGKRAEARAFGIPLMPADEHAEASEGGNEIQKSGVAGGEVELLVVKRVIGDVHLAIDPGDFAVSIEHGGGVVIDA